MSWSEAWSRRTVLATAAASLAGCNFALRQPPKLGFSSIALTGFSPRSPMLHELRRQLAQQVRVLETPDGADVVLQALNDARERSVVASTSAAEVRALQLRARFGFRAQTPSGRVLIPPTELLLASDLSYLETTALAKEYEEADLFREMQGNLVNQVLRRLAAVRL